MIDAQNSGCSNYDEAKTITQEVNMDTKQKLLDLLGGTNFRLIDSGSSAEEFKEIIQYNQKQYDRLEVKGEQHQERILDLMCFILANKIQPMMISRFGNTSGYSLHRILHESFYAHELGSEWEEYKQTALQALGDDGLDERQLEIISKAIDTIPEVMISLLVCIVGRLKVVPMQEVGNISKILAKMMKEGEYGDNKGHN